MDPHLLTPILVGALVAFAIFRRIRRNFGRQAVRDGRLIFRVVVLGIIGALMLVFSFSDLRLLGALGVGLVGGVVLGYFGLRHTVFETTDEGRFYTPHTYIGLLVTALFLGRIASRYLTVTMSANAMDTTPGIAFMSYQRSPSTLAVFGVLVGYYVYFNLGVLKASRVPG